jgi:hypothetical protein
MKLSGYQPPDSGDNGPVTLVYQAPDRFRAVQRPASTRGVTVTTIQLGRDRYEQDSRQPSVWVHHTDPGDENRWHTFLTTFFDTLTGVKRVSRSGGVYRFKERVPPYGDTAAAVATVARGHLVSADQRGKFGPGKTAEFKIKFSRFGAAPDVRPPTGTIQEGR